MLDKDTLAALQLLNKDLKEAAKMMSKDEIRYFVDTYYDIQDFRIATGNRVRTLSDKPSLFTEWFKKNLDTLEHQIWIMMDKWSSNQDMGKWARQITGIGPVISSGLCCNIDITRAPTVGHIWRFAGLDPTSKWLKGQKRPWNASLKRLCWLIGESFVKVQNHEKDIYGKLYVQRRAYETAKNVNYEYAEQCKAREIKKDMPVKFLGKEVDLRELLASGRFPDVAIHERCKRWAVKQFLSDWHAAAFRIVLKQEPPLPYPIAHMGHAHLRTVGLDFNTGTE